MSAPVVLFAANRGFALAGSRLGLIKQYLGKGWRVVLVTTDDEHSRALVALGAELEPVAFERGGLWLFADLVALLRLIGVFRRWRPHLAHLFHAKPMILGARAGRWVLGDRLRLVCTVTGLGQAYDAGGFTGWLARRSYRWTLHRFDLVIFQNPDDRQTLLATGCLSMSRARLIVGSGVDLVRFQPDAVQDRSDAPVALMVARLLRSKGVGEFIAAARSVRAAVPGAVFRLVGESEPSHPDAFPPEDIEAAVRSGDIEFLGYRRDVERCLRGSDLFVFPSRYREGVPRVVMEAAACGLPTVGVDVPGTREAIRDGQTGYLVPPGDTSTLVARITTLMAEPELRLRFGVAARALAVREFDIEAISAQQVAVYRELGVAPEQVGP
jgi:glycosyltransferase involved in cell wall biosynthesis